MNKAKQHIPDIQNTLNSLGKGLNCRFFSLSEIPDAITWAERGHVSIHENYHTRRKHSYHVISSNKEAIEAFCQMVGIPLHTIKASEYYRFWHVNWVP